MKSIRIIDSLLAALVAGGGVWFIVRAILDVINTDIHTTGKIIVCWFLASIGVILSGVIIGAPFFIARRISVIRRYKRRFV